MTALESQETPRTAARDCLFRELTGSWHKIVPAEQVDGLLTGSALHSCRDDTYVRFYAFASDGRFTIRHRVTGPNKNYTATTAYTRRPHPEITA